MTINSRRRAYSLEVTSYNQKSKIVKFYRTDSKNGNSNYSNYSNQAWIALVETLDKALKLTARRCCLDKQRSDQKWRFVWRPMDRAQTVKSL